MKNTPSLKVRSFVFFLIAQFLNVQIQTSFATEAVVTNSLEAQQAISKAKEHIASKLERKGENAVLHIAYRLYKMDVKLANKAIQREQNEEVTLTDDEMD